MLVVVVVVVVEQYYFDFDHICGLLDFIMVCVQYIGNNKLLPSSMQIIFMLFLQYRCFYDNDYDNHMHRPNWT